MSEYRAWRVYEEDGQFKGRIEALDTDDLPAGEVLIDVKWSSLNYKDALSASGNKGVTRKYPHTPGIDAAGVVLESADSRFKPGDEVIVTGFDLGMNTPGGLGERIRVPAGWVIACPAGLDLRQAMVLGTAGLTAGLSVAALMERVKPEHGPVLVTGASGGVGMVAVALLAKLGFEVEAVSGKANASQPLKQLGASRVSGRDRVDSLPGKPLLKPEWAGVVDTVGGAPLGRLISATAHSGALTTCGMVAGISFESSIFPFILRGVTLYGIDSVEIPLARKADIWAKFAGEWAVDLSPITHETGLEGVGEAVASLLDGTHSGRTVVRHASA
ncbi:MAG: acryloyl-CoA reductase [Gammaproteobacteria bacterium]|nr:MAG: acryloyl-CoA reductase [Gammaproteobacteria bacterium]